MAGAGALFKGEHRRLASTHWTPTAITLLTVSCVIGVAISYTGWKCRSMVTATCYTVLGVANKMATVLVTRDEEEELVGRALQHRRDDWRFHCPEPHRIVERVKNASFLCVVA